MPVNSLTGTEAAATLDLETSIFVMAIPTYTQLKAYFQFLIETALQTSAFWSKSMLSSISSSGPGATFLSGKESRVKNFPGGPVVKTPRFQCRGRGFDPWSGN